MQILNFENTNVFNFYSFRAGVTRYRHVSIMSINIEQSLDTSNPVIIPNLHKAQI